jgi:dihydrofolate reductase
VRLPAAGQGVERDAISFDAASGHRSTNTGKGTSLVGKLISSMSVSLDGYIAGPDGTFDWSVPSQELHRFHNERARELGCHLLGRNLYETMVYWETLEEVEGNTRLVRDGVVEEVKRLKGKGGRGPGGGGAGLAATLIKAGLVDEFQPFVYPVIVGGGTLFIPDLNETFDLELVETQTFGSRVVSMRYRRSRRE